MIELTSSQTKPLVKEATVREVAVDKDLQKFVQQQTAQIVAQQKQIESLIAAMKNLEPKDGQKKARKCWLCEETVALPSYDYRKVQVVEAGPILIPARSIRVLEGSTNPSSGSPSVPW